MSLEHIERIEPKFRGECPVCAGWIIPASRVEETEILSCPECRTMLVIDRIEGTLLRLAEAPQIEEDWGE
jgi:lysine biosynthesis protein LysW